MKRNSRTTTTTASTSRPTTGSMFVESKAFLLDVLAAHAPQRSEAGVVALRLAYDEPLGARVELDVRRRLATDVRDLPGAVLLSVVLDDGVDPFVEALAAWLRRSAVLRFGDLVAARDDRRAIGPEAIRLGAAAVRHREP